MATDIVLKTALNALFMAYPNAKLRDGTMTVYYEMLSDIPDDVLKAAVDDLIANSEYFPTISVIRKSAALLQTGVAAAPDAPAAWAEVCEAMRQGVAFQPRFSHPFIDRIVTDMNWYNLRMSETQAADRARFIEAYEALLNRLVRSVVVPVRVQALAARVSQGLLEDGKGV